MHMRRHLACLLLIAYPALQAQTPLPPPPEPMLGMPAPSWAAPAAPAVPINPPTSAAAARHADLPAVAIREFRSSVGEVPARGATDMFMAALVKTHKFRVLERSRLAEGIGAEKALNQQGASTGDVGRSQYIGATYLFEATISEASSGDRSSSFTLGGVPPASQHELN